MGWESYENELNKLGYDNEALKKIKRAFLFAEVVHKNEKRFSGDPYMLHPVAVSLKIAQLKLDADTIAASLLHDVVENQGIKIEELKKEFGEEVAFLVDGVTKVDRIRYKGIERTTESFRKMFLALAQDIRVVVIKLMDRLHNMQTLEHIQNPDKRKRIALETLEIFSPLADRLGMWEIKAELEDLSFKYVYPEEYDWASSQIKERLEEGRQNLEKVTPLINEELNKEDVRAIKILYRVKNLFSIWNKLVKKEMNFDRILDITAMRIIVNSVEDCYRALGIIHKLWKPVPGRIKDYIALPKPNGYQSLHTSVFGPHKKIIEIQIRTVEMNEEAEFGIAAHWAYKHKGTDGKKLAADKKFRWIGQLQDWYKDHQSESSDESLNNLKIDLFKDRIFVFTPKGDVFDLPEGSTPIDFAYQVHSDIGDHMFGAKVNGKLVPFSYELKSGEAVEIIPQKNKKPTADWLDFAKTSMAKNRIRSYLRKNGADVPPAKTQTKAKSGVFEAIATVRDRVGILKDITHVFSKLKINISGVSTDFNNTNFPKISLTFAMRPGLSKSKILTEVKKIKDVEGVSILEKRV